VIVAAALLWTSMRWSLERAPDTLEDPGPIEQNVGVRGVERRIAAHSST
jgi:hypothetical protein